MRTGPVLEPGQGTGGQSAAHGAIALDHVLRLGSHVYKRLRFPFSPRPPQLTTPFFLPTFPYSLFIFLNYAVVPKSSFPAQTAPDADSSVLRESSDRMRSEPPFSINVSHPFLPFNADC